MAKSKSTLAMPSEEDWRARNDMDTLARAEEIKRDAKRLQAAQREAQKQVQSMSTIMKHAPVKKAAQPARRLANKRI